MATIAVDFDNTFTRDVELWTEFGQLAISRGHDVLCVTARKDTELHRKVVEEFGVPFTVLFTGGAPKAWLLHKRGIHVDIWIDDCPESVGDSRRWMEGVVTGESE